MEFQQNGESVLGALPMNEMFLPEVPSYLAISSSDPQGGSFGMLKVRD